LAHILISITHSTNDADKATVGFVIGNAAVASDQETTIFLSCEGVRLAQRATIDEIHEDGFAALSELVENFLEADGHLLVCSPCAKKRGIGEGEVIKGAQIVGGARVVELLAGGATGLSY